jgi:histidine ammonia-lyase
MLARYALAIAGLALPIVALALGGEREVMPGAPAHFWAVMLSAGTAALVAAGVTVIGVRARDGRAMLLGTAFSTTTALLAVHGMATRACSSDPTA